MRKAFSGTGATVALHKLMPKHEPRPKPTPTPHKHTYEQLVYIIAGHIRFHVGDKSVVLGPGGLLQTPPDVMHWGEVVGESRFSTSTFSPGAGRVRAGLACRHTVSAVREKSSAETQ